MRIVSITVSYQRVFNLGNYESLRLEETIAAELDEDEDPDAARLELWEQVKASVKAQALPVLRKREEQVQAIAASLPAGVIER